jgi:hypothetical protein
MSEIRRGASRGLWSPICAEVSTSVSMARPNIVTSTAHMIWNCICKYSHSSCSASLNHITEFLSRSMTSLQLVTHRLIVEPPRVKLTLLRPFKGKDTFLRREYLKAHPTHLSERFTLVFNVRIGPSEEFDDCTFLSSVVH